MNSTTAIDTTAPYIAFGEPMPAPDFTRMKRASTALGELTALLKPLVGPMELASGTDLGRGGLTLFQRAGWVSAVEYRRGTPRNAILHLDFDHEGRNAVVRMAGTGSIGDRTRWEASHISEAIRMCVAEVEYSCEVGARSDLVDRMGDLGKVSVTPGRKAGGGVFVATLMALLVILMGAFRGPASAQPASCKSMPAGAHWIACGPNDPGPDAAVAALRAEEARQAVAPAAPAQAPPATITIKTLNGRLITLPGDATPAEQRMVQRFEDSMDLTKAHILASDIQPCDIQVSLVNSSIHAPVVGFPADISRALAVYALVESGDAPEQAAVEFDRAVTDQQRTCPASSWAQRLEAFNRAWFK